MIVKFSIITYCKIAKRFEKTTVWLRSSIMHCLNRLYDQKDCQACADDKKYDCYDFYKFTRLSKINHYTQSN